MTLSDYRAKHGLSLEALALKLGKSKGHLHAVEKDGYATARLALDIESLTEGAVDAATLNPEIREARRAAA
jgi:transcriptional regulator with XRE-family HTH domain